MEHNPEGKVRLCFEIKVLLGGDTYAWNVVVTWVTPSTCCQVYKADANTNSGCTLWYRLSGWVRACSGTWKEQNTQVFSGNWVMTMMYPLWRHIWPGRITVVANRIGIFRKSTICMNGQQMWPPFLSILDTEFIPTLANEGNMGLISYLKNGDKALSP